MTVWSSLGQWDLSRIRLGVGGTFLEKDGPCPTLPSKEACRKAVASLAAALPLSQDKMTGAEAAILKPQRGYKIHGRWWRRKQEAKYLMTLLVLCNAAQCSNSLPPDFVFVRPEFVSICRLSHYLWLHRSPLMQTLCLKLLPLFYTYETQSSGREKDLPKVCASNEVCLPPMTLPVPAPFILTQTLGTWGLVCLCENSVAQGEWTLRQMESPTLQWFLLLLLLC